MTVRVCSFLITAAWLMLLPALSFGETSSARDIMERAAGGDAVAEYELGRIYQGGRNVPQDEFQAAQWYRRSAEQGYAPAEVSLGVMYLGGAGGLPRDDGEGRKWIGRASEQGDHTGEAALRIHEWLQQSSLVAAIGRLPDRYRSGVVNFILSVPIAVVISGAVLSIILMQKGLRKLVKTLRRKLRESGRINRSP